MCAEDLSVRGPQDVEAAVLAADADHLRRLALHRDRVDLGRVADRLILVAPFLRVVRPHRVGPDVARVDLRDPLLGFRCRRRARRPRTTRACTGRGSSEVGRRGAVLTSVPKKIVPVSASNDGVLQIELVAGPVIEDVVAPAILDRDRRVRALGLGPEVVFPDDLAGLRLEGHDEPAAGITR